MYIRHFVSLFFVKMAAGKEEVFLESSESTPRNHAHDLVQVFDDDSDTENDLSLEEGENWLRLVDRSHTAGNLALDNTQDMTPERARLPYPVLLQLGSIDAPTTDCYICIDVDGPNVAIKDMRSPFVSNADEEDALDIFLVRRKPTKGETSTPSSSVDSDLPDHQDKTTTVRPKTQMWRDYGGFEALPRRQLRFLRNGDRICTRLPTAIRTSAGVRDGDIGLVLEYRFSVNPNNRSTHNNGFGPRSAIAAEASDSDDEQDVDDEFVLTQPVSDEEQDNSQTETETEYEESQVLLKQPEKTKVCEPDESKNAESIKNSAVPSPLHPESKPETDSAVDQGDSLGSPFEALRKAAEASSYVASLPITQVSAVVTDKQDSSPDQDAKTLGVEPIRKPPPSSLEPADKSINDAGAIPNIHSNREGSDETTKLFPVLTTQPTVNNNKEDSDDETTLNQSDKEIVAHEASPEKDGHARKLVDADDETETLADSQTCSLDAPTQENILPLRPTRHEEKVGIEQKSEDRRVMPPDVSPVSLLPDDNLLVPSAIAQHSALHEQTKKEDGTDANASSSLQHEGSNPMVRSNDESVEASISVVRDNPSADRPQHFHLPSAIAQNLVLNEQTSEFHADANIASSSSQQNGSNAKVQSSVKTMETSILDRDHPNTMLDAPGVHFPDSTEHTTSALVQEGEALVTSVQACASVTARAACAQNAGSFEAHSKARRKQAARQAGDHDSQATVGLEEAVPYAGEDDSQQTIAMESEYLKSTEPGENPSCRTVDNSAAKLDSKVFDTESKDEKELVLQKPSSEVAIDESATNQDAVASVSSKNASKKKRSKIANDSAVTKEEADESPTHQDVVASDAMILDSSNNENKKKRSKIAHASEEETDLQGKISDIPCENVARQQRMILETTLKDSNDAPPQNVLDTVSGAASPISPSLNETGKAELPSEDATTAESFASPTSHESSRKTRTKRKQSPANDPVSKRSRVRSPASQSVQKLPSLANTAEVRVIATNVNLTPSQKKVRTRANEVACLDILSTHPPCGLFLDD